MNMKTVLIIVAIITLTLTVSSAYGDKRKIKQPVIIKEISTPVVTVEAIQQVTIVPEEIKPTVVKQKERPPITPQNKPVVRRPCKPGETSEKNKCHQVKKIQKNK